MANNAKLPDINSLIQAGIDPKTGLPIRMAGLDGGKLKEDIKRSLRILDEQSAIRKFVWVNLPNGLTGELVERILYYKGQAMFFFMPTDEKFYFLPYALDGNINCYGEFLDVTPLPFAGPSATTNPEGKVKPWITGLKRHVIREIPEDYNLEDFENGCVLLHDYSKQMSETIIPRQIIQEPILDAMSEAFPLARTSLIANSGIKGMRVNSEEDQAQVKAASRSITRAAMAGDPWVPIVSQIEFQDLTSAGSALKSEEYLLYMQALDNYRLSLHGLKNGGLFQKKSHMLESEQEMNDGNTLFAFQDGLTLRQEFCDLVNSIWGLGIAVIPAEQVSGMDTNGDGYVGENDMSNQMNAAEGEAQEVNNAE